MIFVTGGAGFIGSNFVIDWLANCNEPVINYDKLTYAGSMDNLASVANDPSHIFVQGDICDGKKVLELLMIHKPRAIIHMAAESHVDRSISDPAAFIDTNVNGTFRMLEAARTYWSSLPEIKRDAFRFLHVSTDEVYGSLSPNQDPFTEESPYRPSNPYAASKAASDHLARSYHVTYGLPVIVTNCSNNYGPRQYPEKLIPLTIISALAGKDITVHGRGVQIRDWIHVKDHCSALRGVLDRAKIGESYNIGRRNERTNISVIRGICAILDDIFPNDSGSYSDKIVHVADRPGQDMRYAINPRKVMRHINRNGFVPFDSGLRSTVEWYINELFEGKGK
jgi:dTDP-glucose 4,6-dehydratase